LSSGGDTRYLLLSDVVTVGVVGLPLAYLLGVTFGFGLWGVFAARLLGEELSRIIMLGLRFRSGRWFDLSSTDVEPATALPA
jgi:Na+-driven multidrug efflux pump